jgi:YVTN family beta-propeller protein
VATIKVGSKPADGVEGPDGLEWIPNQGDGTITRIDPATNAVRDTIQVTRLPFVVRTGFGDVWVDDFGGKREWRLHVSSS